MAKEVVISTSGLNSYGSRILTEGIDLTQYERNPVLLWMHRRCFDRDVMPIGRMEDLRLDGDRLIGTPVFDTADPFAAEIGRKWEDGFLRMASAGIEIIETSDDPAVLVPGQTRSTITRCRLMEVSIVDIGANDDAMQLYKDGNRLTLSRGECSECLPLLEIEQTTLKASANKNENNNLIKTHMNKETLQLLGLSENATEQEQHEAVRMLKERADEADTLKAAAVKVAVEAAIADGRITEAQREHFMNLGKTVGAEMLSQTLGMMRPAQKPSDIINQENRTDMGTGEKTYSKLSEVPADELGDLREKNPKEYMRLYKEEYGIELEAIEH